MLQNNCHDINNNRVCVLYYNSWSCNFPVYLSISRGSKHFIY